nr:uncharacterized protein LOC117834538 [Setaria viridis]XP_034569985.1 uncharacterized protein LOC117834539 [Setaria viridis]XP_034569986.1 uncharacterized protein LOC117834541 [Setaria viridis]
MSSDGEISVETLLRSSKKHWKFMNEIQLESTPLSNLFLKLPTPARPAAARRPHPRLTSARTAAARTRIRRRESPISDRLNQWRRRGGPRGRTSRWISPAGSSAGCLLTSTASGSPPCAPSGNTDACGNWLVFSGEDGCFLRDPFSNATVPLPALSRDRICYVGDESIDEANLAWLRKSHRLILEEPRRWKLMFCSPHLIAALVSLRKTKRIAVCQPGTNSWWSVSVENNYPYFVDMAFHQGKLYALTILGILCAIDISVDSSTANPWVSEMRKIIDDPPFSIPLVTKMTYLVESRGVLLVVLRKLAEGVTGGALPETAACEQNEIEVFEASLRQSETIDEP